MIKEVVSIFAAAVMTTAPPDEETVTLTERQAAVCQAEGGCALVTEKALQNMRLGVFMDGYFHGAKSCGKSA